MSLPNPRLEATTAQTQVPPVKLFEAQPEGTSPVNEPPGATVEASINGSENNSKGELALVCAVETGKTETG